MQELTLKEISAAVDGEIIIGSVGDSLQKISVVSTDTRNITAGCLYIAIKGETFDGHDFIDKAFELGAAAAISDVCAKNKIASDKPVVYVKNTRLAFGALATYYRSKFHPYVVGVTGSVGKTSTKEMIYTVMSQHYKVLKTKGNFNNDIGLPRTLLELDDSYKGAVIEMGMSHLGEISYLTKLAKPTIAVITNVGVSHLENLKTRENILKAKLEILDGMPTDAKLILNADNDMLETIKDEMADRAIWFGTKNPADVTAADISQIGEKIEFTINFRGESYHAIIPTIGIHNVSNALAAFLVGIQIGMSPEKIVESFNYYKNSGMRQNITERDGITVIADCYNASPDSMQSAVNVISSVDCSGKRIAVFGDMLELGKTSDQMHADVGKMVADSNIDILLCYGYKSKHMHKSAIKANHPLVEHFENKSELVAALKSLVKIGDAIIFKASRGMRLEEVIEAVFS